MTTVPEPDGIVWHISSYSANGSACVEVGWRTSSYSPNGGDCVEVATTPDAVLVRDSKDRDGPALTVPAATWRAFLATLTR
ncbi:MAG TPA: DUF397 domain-containing protein [Pseudonocardiaceae bacterium]|jgi:hypothetical protein